MEKPFGNDLDSSEQLAETIGALLPEIHLYRIDHYLGKVRGRLGGMWVEGAGMAALGSRLKLYEHT